MKAHNTIEINGRLYDAHTGQPLVSASKKQTPANKPAGSKSIDGFHAAKISPHSAAKPRTTIAVKSAVKPPVKTPTPATTPAVYPSRTAAPALKRKPHRSITLHRHGVKKPVFTDNTTSQTSAQIAHAAPTVAVSKATSQRLERAEQIKKSAAISHFKRTAKPSGIAVHTPHIKEAASPQKIAASTSQHTPKTQKEQLIQHAISQAVAHHHTEATHQKVHKKKHRGHIMRYASTAALVLVLGAYVAYLNVPGISMKVAAHRAGFAAAFPSYQPAGYSLSGPIAYSPGQVTINFSSNTDSRKFSLKQQPTTWDSTALLENYVTKQTPNYLTYQDRGLTIYIFNGSSAAWVNGGKLYKLEGQNSQLDTDQLLKLATSV